MAGINGASCTRAMKVEPRLAFQHPTDRHAFGYTNDKGDIDRFERLKANYPELDVRAPLIEQGINKANCSASWSDGASPCPAPTIWVSRMPTACKAAA
jgi:hypothetical protein